MTMLDRMRECTCLPQGLSHRQILARLHTYILEIVVLHKYSLLVQDIDTVVFLTQEASAAQDPDMQEQLWAAAKSYAQGLSTGPLPPSINKWLLPRSLMESYRRRPTSNVPQPAGDGGAAVGHQQQPPKPEGPLQAPKQEGPPQANKPELFLPDPKPEAPPQVPKQEASATPVPVSDDSEVPRQTTLLVCMILMVHL